MALGTAYFEYKKLGLLSPGLILVPGVQFFVSTFLHRAVPTSSVYQWLDKVSLPATLVSAASNKVSSAPSYLRKSKRGPQDGNHNISWMN